MKRDLLGVGGKGKKSEDGGVEMGTVIEEGKQQATTGINANLTPDFRGKVESNDIGSM